MAERLEPRLLYSADALGALLPLLDESEPDDELRLSTESLLAHARVDGHTPREASEGSPGADGTLDDLGAHRSSGSGELGADHVVFVDASVPDAAALTTALSASGATVVTVGHDEDGLLVISRTLAARDGLAAVHLVSHGEPGAIALGKTALDTVSLTANGEGVSRWGAALREGGDLLLYGCEAGAGERGAQLVGTLTELTGADVAASTDVTGHAALGGDWTLERRSGTIGTDTLEHAFAAADWRHLLDTITITFEDDGVNVPVGTTIADLKALQDGGQGITLREAVQAAEFSPGADTIVLGSGTWRLGLSGDGDDVSASGDLDVHDELTLRGAGSGVTAIVMEAADKDRLIEIHAGWSLTLDGVTLSGGDANDGGAMRVSAGAALHAHDVVIDGNSADDDGGGIYAEGELELNDVIVSNNTVGDSGGGIFGTAASDLTLDGVRVVNNAAMLGGGGGIEVDGSLAATDLEMRLNTAMRTGGALHVTGGATIDGGLFADNVASTGKGGAIGIDGTLVLSDAQFSDNVALESGGAISLGGNAALERVTFEDNTAGESGGGLAQENSDKVLTLKSVTFSGNDAKKGGGLYVRGEAEIVNATFVGEEEKKDGRDDWDNKDEEKGGEKGGEEGGEEGGAIYAEELSEVRVRNSVFQNNETGEGDNSVKGEIVSTGFNVFSHTPGTGYAGAASDLTGIDARLQPLAYNGGLVRTHAPSADSPLINAGSITATTVDATGQVRDAVPDIGAYESRTAADVIWLIDENGKLLRAPSDLSHVQVLRDDLDRAGNIVVDLDGERLYWAEEGGMRFVVADLDGHELRSATMRFDPMSAFAIDTVNDHVVVAEGGATPRIYRVSLVDLGEMKNVVTTNIFDPRAIEIRGSGGVGDPVRAYWAEQGGEGVTRAIRSAAADTGAGIETHVDGASGVSDFDDGDFIDLAVSADADDFFWTDASKGRIVGFSSSDSEAVYRDLSTLSGIEPGSIALLDAQERVIYSSTTSFTERVSVVDEDLSGDLDLPRLDDKILSLDTARTVVGGKPVEAEATADQTAHEGDSDVVSTLSASADGAAAAALVWEVVRAPAFGRFEIAGDEVTAFTQDDVDFGRVFYRHFGSEDHADSVELEVFGVTGRSETVTLAIDIEPVNDAPTAISLDATIVAENAPGVLVGHLTTTDSDADDTATYTVIGDERFAVEGDRLRLAATTALDFESLPDGSIEVEIETRDRDGATLRETFAIAVTDANDAPHLVGSLLPQRASTGQPFVLPLDTALWRDPDIDDVLTLAVREPGGGALPTWLTFDARTNGLSGIPPAGALGVLQLEATVSDQGGLSGTPLALSIDIVDGNSAPTAIALEAATVAENAPGATIGRLTASDPDGGDSASFAVSDPRFAIDGEELRLASGRSLDFETTPRLDVQIVATDSGGANRRETFTIDVTDVNETPTGIALEASVVAENDPGAMIGRLSSTDPDANDPPEAATYAVIGDERFAVEGDRLRLAATTALDFESLPGGSIEVEIETRDRDGATLRETFAIDVADVNEAPTGIALEARVVAENDPGATIGRLSVTDPDAGDAVRFTVDDPRFVTNGDRLGLVSGASLDFESTPSIELALVAVDSGGKEHRETVELDVLDVNDAPVVTVTPPSVTLGKGESYALSADAFSDQDGDPLTFGVRSLPEWIDFDAATLTFEATGSGRFDGTPESADLGVSDGRDGTATLEVTFTYRPEAMSSPPLVRPDTFTLREGNTLIVTGSDSLLVNDRVDATRGSLTALLVEGPAHGELTLSGDGSFRYEHDGGESRTDAFDYRVSDASGALSAPVSVTLVVEPVNDPPLTVRDIGEQRAREGEPFVLAIDTSVWIDPDEGDALSIRVTLADGRALPRWLVHDVERGELRGTPGVDDTGMLALRIVARDASGAEAAPVELALAVENVNAPPGVVTLASEGVNENRPGAFVGELSAIDPDPDDTVRFATADARFAIEGSRLSLRPEVALDFEAGELVMLEVRATDTGGASVVDEVSVRVLDGNDAPASGTTALPAAVEGVTRYVVPDGAFVDADDDPLAYRATRTDGGPLPEWLTFDPITRTFAIEPLAKETSEEPTDELAVEVRLLVDDGRGGTAASELSFRRAPLLGGAEPKAPSPGPALGPFIELEMPVPVPVTTLERAGASGPETESRPAETPPETRVSEVDEPSLATPSIVDDLVIGMNDIDLRGLLRSAAREIGELELRKVPMTVESSVLTGLARFLPTDIDTIDLSELLGDSDLNTSLRSTALAAALDSERGAVDDQAALTHMLVGGSAGLSTGLSVGYLIWLIRGGTLMGSVLSSLPAWRFVDPLPVLGTLTDEVDGEGDDVSLQTLVSDKGAGR